MSTNPPTIFLTGATGFVGGTILSHLSQSHPDYHIKALIRQESVAQTLKSTYPTNFTPILGDLSSLSLLESTASESDLVIHATGGDDTMSAVCAMIDGLALRDAVGITGKAPLPRLISITGPRSLIDPSKPITGTLSSPTSRPWSDTVDVHTILSLPSRDRMHAGADQAIIAHSSRNGIGAMLVSPGQLWGRGNGCVNREGRNSTAYYKAVKDRGRGFVVGEGDEAGSATWSWTSIGDLGRAVVFLVERAMAGDQSVGVNEDGYYFVSTGDLSMIERARAINARLGLGDEVDCVSVEVARQIHPFGHIMWGCGERIRADRLGGLGWKPVDTDWKALMEEEGGERA